MIGSTLTAQTVADLSSPELQAHADLPQYFRAGPSIQELLAEARAGAAARGIPWKGLDFQVFDADNVAGFTSTGAQQTYTNLTCSADVIALGHVTASASHVSTFGLVYTDYLQVDKVLLDKQALIKAGPALLSKLQIVVTRKGGTVVVDGDRVHFQFESSPDLKPRETYLQFLRFIPQSSAFQSIDSFSTLRENGQSWVMARNSSAAPVPGLTLDNLESTLKNWRNSC